MKVGLGTSLCDQGFIGFTIFLKGNLPRWERSGGGNGEGGGDCGWRRPFFLYEEAMVNEFFLLIQDFEF